MTIIDEEVKKARFDTLLAHLMELIETEIRREDDDRRGLKWRDGGRKLQAAMFLTTAIKNVLRGVKGEVGKMKGVHKCGDSCHGDRHYGKLNEDETTNTALSHVEELLENLIK
jgi:hypothetical protein